MRKPKGKLVALLAGAVVVVLVAVSWRDTYCHLFLDPRLVGRWACVDRVLLLEFDRVGNVASVILIGDLEDRVSGIYSIDGNSLTMAWTNGDLPDVYRYRIDRNLLRLYDESSRLHHTYCQTYRRVSDDS